ncbi:MAG: DNA-directed RNA polymerase subunit K [Thermoproteota archaeon]|nr:DNA-directed RNA polymerase subunit K [Thermoproteota archaeon]
MKEKRKARAQSIKEKSEILDLNPSMPLSSKEIRYERARIIGIRAMQLLQGAEPLIEVPSDVTDPIKIATLEFEAGKLPFVIKRGFDTKTEKLSELS